MNEFKLANLPYEYDALEPYISSETLRYHHDKHHQTYINVLNKLIIESNDANLADMTLSEVIRSNAPLPGEHPSKIFNNAAQAANHDIYWPSMMKDGGKNTINGDGLLFQAIEAQWNNFDLMIAELKSAAMAQFGSGWVWLVCDINNNKQIKIIKTDNAYTPVTQMHLIPLLNIDIWEHSYYIDHRNNRQAYVDGFFDNLVNWKFAEENFNLIK